VWWKLALSVDHGHRIGGLLVKKVQQKRQSCDRLFCVIVVRDESREALAVRRQIYLRLSLFRRRVSVHIRGFPAANESPPAVWLTV
jgi:hypothetical protein